MITELANQGDIQNLIEQSCKYGQKIDEKYIWKCLADSLVGLNVLHSMNVLHRDLKSANIFITNKTTNNNDINSIEYKLGDMNVSKISEDGLVYTQTGTPYYASPEVWRDEPYDNKSDVWSLGIVIYQLVMLEVPFKGKDLDVLF